MSVSQTAIVEGNVARVSSRDVTSKTTGQLFTFVSMLVIGEECLADVRIPDGKFPPKQGDFVRMRVIVSSYRDDAELTLDDYIGVPAVKAA